MITLLALAKVSSAYTTIINTMVYNSNTESCKTSTTHENKTETV